MDVAELASSLEPDATADLVKAMKHEDSAVRYWAVMGILMRGGEAVENTKPQLREALTDSSPSVRIVAAEALGRYGDASDLNQLLPVLQKLASVRTNSLYISLMALNAIDTLDDKAAPLKEFIAQLPHKDDSVHPRLNAYVPDLIEKILPDLSEVNP